jgi:energy-converting hydrogenase Eha subunit H
VRSDRLRSGTDCSFIVLLAGLPLFGGAPIVLGETQTVQKAAIPVTAGESLGIASVANCRDLVGDKTSEGKALARALV